MRLSDQLRDDFEPDVRERGLRYLMQGRVQGLRHVDDVLHATVNGSQRYHVEITLGDDDFVEYSCTCPAYETRGQACKHLWAVLLEADRVGVRSESSVRRQAVSRSADAAGGVEDAEDDDPLEDESDEGLDGPDDADERPAAAAEGRLKWQQVIESLAVRAAEEAGREVTQRRGERPLAADKRLVYVLVLDPTHDGSDLYVRVYTQSRLSRGGGWGPIKSSPVVRHQMLMAPDESDRALARVLLGSSAGGDLLRESDLGFRVEPEMFDPLIDQMVATGRCFLSVEGFVPQDPLELDTARPWQLRLRIEADDADCRSMRPVLHRDGVVRSLEEASLLSRSGHVLFPEAWARLEAGESWHFIEHLDPRRPIRFPADDLMAVLKELPSSRPPPLMVDEACGLETTQTAPVRVLVLRPPAPYAVEAGVLQADLRFDYPDRSVPAGAGDSFWLSTDQKTLHERDHSAEQEAIEQLLASGWRRIQRRNADEPAWELSEKRFFVSLRQLVNQQWRIEREGKPLRNPGRISISVSSGIDWFDLSGHVEFGEYQVPLPELLKALRQKKNTIVLADGSQGVVPAELLEQQALLMAIGRAEGDVIRYEQSQVGVLASLLESVDDSRADETFNAVLRKIERFESPAPAEAPESFIGTLRPYQREGLGWIEFLEECRLGGCLADDMGLGKTIQVLAMLEKRRLEGKGPSLAVVPKSLVFNWRNEAQKFTPQLSVIDHTGVDRPRDGKSLMGSNLVLTTYGTLRRDIGILREVEFDYLILDESQAIKNAASQSAKSAKLLRGRNRLALSGTPIENSVSDLWSLMDFLNPGLLGSSSGLTRALGDASHNVEARKLLARAVRPMVLRRTKQQVATDLPARTEQTLLVELEPDHRALYDQMRQHYRAELLGQTQVDLNRSKLVVLESLLRLRQLACHPGLIDPKLRNTDSAKVSALLEQLEELLAEGHKALVFSQFTSLLALLQPALKKRGIVYEYLDGQTRDRQQRVQRFQSDENCRLFLISLKAGGVGLNLTAADYVFLLDPWWNPAVEAQAIDRAHRIGQTRPVIAYRIIAQDTVEEKVLKLQQSKRELADAIINGGDTVLSALSREDLELLLS